LVWGLNAKTPTEWGFTQVGVRGLKDEVLSYPLSCSGLHPFVFLQEAKTPCVTPSVFTSSGSDGIQPIPKYILGDWVSPRQLRELPQNIFVERFF